MTSRVTAFALILLAPLALAEGEDCRLDGDCADGEFCSYLQASCLGDRPFGRCITIPPGGNCTHLYMPVCGCDLQTHGNGCEAAAESVSLLYLGECEPCDATGARCSEGRVCGVERSACSSDYEGTCLPPVGGREWVHLEFTGSVDEGFDGLGLFAGLQPGDRFHGSLSYDLTTPDTGFDTEGDVGRYEHDSPAAGLRVTVAGFGTSGALPVVEVHDEAGFAGADAFGTYSESLALQAGLDGFLSWWLQEFIESPVANVALPPCPVDPGLFENNRLQLRIDCPTCAGPAAFSEIEGAVDLLEHALVLELDASLLRWSAQPSAIAYDVVAGDLDSLGDFTLATSGCLAEDTTATTQVSGADPLPGQGLWYLVRAERADGSGSYDGFGQRLQAPRDGAIAASGADCG